MRLVRWGNLLFLGALVWVMEKWVAVPILNAAAYGEQMPWYILLLLEIAVILIAAGGYVINDYFDVLSRQKIMILAVKVWQEEKKKFHDVCFDEIYSKFRNQGYSISNVELPNTYVKCDTDLKHARVIFHNGKVDKCNNILPDEAHSILRDDGTIEEVKKDCTVWDDILSQEPCCNCKFLPVCMGPCLNIKRKMLCTSGCLKCADVENHWSIRERIKNYCLIKSKERLL